MGVSSHGEIILEEHLVDFVMPCYKEEFVAIYELDEAKGCCIGSFVVKFPLKEACGKEESSNRVSLYVHVKVSRLGGMWHLYHDVKIIL